MKFCLNDFLELNTNELLTVNGGYYCNGSSPSTTITPNTYYPTGGGDSGGGSSGGGGCSAVNIPPKPPKRDGDSIPIATSGTCSNINLGKHLNNTTLDPVSEENLKNSLNDHYNEKYILGENDCDHWVETVLKDAGYDIGADWGSVDETVNAHEQKLVGKTTKSPSGEWSVVLMTDSKNGKMSHTGIIRVDSTGAVWYSDCSSQNSNKGSKYSWFPTVSDFEAHYGSDSCAGYTDYDYLNLTTRK